MKPEDIVRSREILGAMWGLGRALKAAELGRALGIDRRDPGRTIIGYETGTPIPGTVITLLYLYLSGVKPLLSMTEIAPMTKPKSHEDDTP